MLKYLPFILLYFFTPVLMAQDTLNRTDAGGLKQGYWRKIDSAGMTIYTGRFIDGKPAGEFRYYYPGGKLKAVSMFSDNGKRSSTVSYYKNGLKMASGCYLTEKKDGIWKFFNEYDGGLVSEETYQNGIREGATKIFYPDGGVSETFSYKNGLKSGLWEQFYLDGKLKLRGAYLNGEKQGALTIFYNSGQAMISGHYLSGHQDGIWNYYTEKGELTKQEQYDKGTLLRSREEPVAK
ncbi:MAG: toxin-antitoxin system YwqK family antitoxin [Alphaproteobacteria bacterium]|nr:toxin-antitoxin system YwqK family antitoxin [Alphaproteobacteria bacterium]